VADAERCSQTHLYLLALSRNAKKVAPADGRRKGPHKQASTPTSCSLYFIGIYSGTRAGAIAAASPIPALGRSYVDLERGRYYRLKQGSAKTNKRQPTVPIPLRLLAHLRRWHRINPETKHFVEYNGSPVTSVKTAFKSAVRLAGLAPGTSHFATHRGDLADAAGCRPVAGSRLSGNVA
jgi:integrase